MARVNKQLSTGINTQDINTNDVVATTGTVTTLTSTTGTITTLNSTTGTITTVNSTTVDTEKLFLDDAITAPGTTTGSTKLYVDTADGDLKAKFGDGYVATLAIDSAPVWTALTLVNSWVDAGSPWQVAEFTQYADGQVQVRGAIKDGTATPNTVLATLPAGSRPAANISFATADPSTFGRIDVRSNGDMVIQVGSNVLLFLDALHFFGE